MSGWSGVYIALGANLGDREATLRDALDALANRWADIRLVRASQFHDTPPVGRAHQPRFLNAAALLETTLSPRALLDRLLHLEREHGRTRAPGERWGPRTLDLDILLFEDLVIDEPGLQIPHPRMTERSFVLAPLAEVGPDVVHPVVGRTIEQLRDDRSRIECSDSGDRAI